MSTDNTGAMTGEERARKIYDIVIAPLRARGKPFTAWAALVPDKQQRLIAAAERLQSEYESAGDPPSRGMR